jgi:hypothetical protein
MEQLKNMKLSLGIVMAVIVQSFGGIWYIATLDSTVASNEAAVIALESTISEMDDYIDELEKKDVLIENEMRTIQSDHQGFNEVLRTIGLAGYGDNRKYGDYD